MTVEEVAGLIRNKIDFIKKNISTIEDKKHLSDVISILEHRETSINRALENISLYSDDEIGTLLNSIIDRLEMVEEYNSNEDAIAEELFEIIMCLHTDIDNYIGLINAERQLN